MVVDLRAWIGAKELDERAVVPLRSIGEWIERRQLVQQLALDVSRQIPASDFVVELGAAGVHHQRAAIGERVLEGQMNLVGPAGDRSHGADGRVQHDRVAGGDPRRRNPAASSCREYMAGF